MLIDYRFLGFYICSRVVLRPVNVENGHPSGARFQNSRAAANETLKMGISDAHF